MTGLVLALLCAAAAADAAPPGGPGPGPAAAAEAARFADWLLARGDFYRAIGEYERALFLDPAADPAPIELRIARAYERGGKPDAAARVLSGVVERGRDPALRDEALFELGRVRYRAGAAEGAAAALGPYLALDAPAGGPGKDRARLLLSLSLLRAGDAARARAALDPAGGSRPGDARAGDAEALRAAILEVERAPRRRPALAGALSAVLPGLGHAYAGDLAGGAGALALNGLFVWAIADAVRDERWGMGALLLAGESIWYGGAIFGAVAEAMRFNRDAREAALDGVEARFGWVVDPVPGGATVGLRGPLGGARD